MKKIVTTTIIFVLGIVFGYYLHKLSVPIQFPSVFQPLPTDTPVSATTDEPAKDGNKPLDSVFTLKTSKGELYILKTENYIAFEPFEHATSPYKSFSITKEKYPQLFKQGIAELSFITAEVFEDNGSVVLTKISNNQPDHGGYMPVYELIVNPITGKTEKIQ